jgi:hypothetical protein
MFNLLYNKVIYYAMRVVQFSSSVFSRTVLFNLLFEDLHGALITMFFTIIICILYTSK